MSTSEKTNHPLRTALNRLVLAPLRESLLDLHELAPGMRWLALTGYVAIVVLLGLTLYCELSSGKLATVPVRDATGDHLVPILVLVVSSAGMALGWTYVLAGAANSWPRVFFPIALFLALQFWYLMPGSTAGVGAWFCTMPLLLGGTITAYVVGRRKGLLEKRFLPVFLACLGLLSYSLALFWLLGRDLPSRALSLSGASNALILLVVPYWLVSGLAVVDAAVRLAHHIVALIMKLLPGDLLRLAATVLLLLPPAEIGLIFLLNLAERSAGQVLLLDTVLTIPLLLAMAILALRRRWNGANAALLLALRLVAPVFSLGLILALNEQDISSPLGMALEKAGFLPPLLLFVVLTAYNVFSTGVRFARSDGPVVPRRARVVLALGTAMLIVSAAFFFVNLRDPGTGEPSGFLQTMVNSLFGVSVLALGLPYLLWIVFKRREQLVPPPTPAKLIELAPDQRRRWMAVGVAVVLFLALTICLVGLLSIKPGGP